MLRQTQQQKLIQKLSPQQIQLMKLLQVPTANLEERIKDELESNPALEVAVEDEEQDPYDDFESEIQGPEKEAEEQEESDPLEDYLQMDLSDYLRDEDDQQSDYHVNEDNDDEESAVAPIRVETTFHDYLKDQLGMLDLDEREYGIALQIIGSIDDDGYLRREVIAIADDLAFNQNVYTTAEEVEALLEVIRQFDPPGVGASDLQECLLIQLGRSDAGTAAHQYATEIIAQHFEEFTRKHYDKIMQKLKISGEELKDAVDIILKLTPKPGNAFASSQKGAHFIIPDFFIYNNNGRLELSLNARNAPELRISEGYKEMLRSYDADKKRSKSQKEALLFIKQKIDAAKWFIDAIKQRQHTLLITMNAIMEYQREFFLTGDESELRPMILKDIAERINMDISTVSRVANSKYVQTEYGTFLLKYFFSEAMVTDSGEEVSTREVKRLLKDIIEEEDKKKPYSDEMLMKLLAKKGYQVARRTVAKYREQLDIAVARLRKEA